MQIVFRDFSGNGKILSQLEIIFEKLEISLKFVRKQFFDITILHGKDITPRSQDW